MARIDNSVNAMAKQIVQRLDSLDGSDGKISSRVWNDIFHVKEKSGKEIKYFINLENAEKSVRTYLRRNSQSKRGQKDLGQKWLDSLSETAQNPSKTTQDKEVSDTQNYVELKPQTGDSIFKKPLIKLHDDFVSKLELPIQLPVIDTNEEPIVVCTNTQTADTKPKEVKEKDDNAFASIEEPDVTDNQSLRNISHDAEKLKNEWAHVKILPNGFYEKVIDISKKINCSPTDLMGLMATESGLDPAVKNGIGAVGLIQFIPSTARLLGTTTKKLRKMSATEQLNYVYKYLDSVKSSAGFKTNDYIDTGTLYALIFLPCRAKKSVLTSRGEIYYNQNRSLDYNKDGHITKSDLGSVINSKKV